MKEVSTRPIMELMQNKGSNRKNHAFQIPRSRNPFQIFRYNQVDGELWGDPTDTGVKSWKNWKI